MVCSHVPIVQLSREQRLGCLSSETAAEYIGLVQPANKFDLYFVVESRVLQLTFPEIPLENSAEKTLWLRQITSGNGRSSFIFMSLYFPRSPCDDSALFTQLVLHQGIYC